MKTHSDSAASPIGMGLTRIVVTVLVPFGCGYFLSYLLRSVNAVVAPDLVRDIGLTASGLGLLTAAYLFAFGAFQLPLGILLDRFGPRRVQTTLLLVSAVGAVMFGLARDEAVLIFARALIGLGFAGGLMGSFKAVVLWVPKERVALFNGCVMVFGGLGTLCATQPFDFLVQIIGWRNAFIALGCVTGLVSATIYFVVPETKIGLVEGRLRDHLRDLGAIYRDRVFWRVAPVVVTASGTHIAVQTLWAGPWLRDVAGLGRDDVAFYLLIMAVAFTVGVLALGVLADLLGRVGISLLQVMSGGFVIFLLAQLGLVLEWVPGTMLLWALFGLTGQTTILAYAHLSGYFGKDLAGRSNAGLNLLVFLAAFTTQYVIGVIISFWPTSPDGGYHLAGYRTAFSVFLALQVLAFLRFLWLSQRERRRREA
jgi:sugar phosphate permease